MTGKELYEQFKGQTIESEDGVVGVVCGYFDDTYEEPVIIIAATQETNKPTWKVDPGNQDDEVIVTNKNNPLGYWAVSKDELAIETPNRDNSLEDEYIHIKKQDIYDMVLEALLDKYKDGAGYTKEELLDRIKKRDFTSQKIVKEAIIDGLKYNLNYL